MTDLEQIDSYYEMTNIILKLRRENEILKDKVKLLEDLIKIANGEKIPHIQYDDIEAYLGADGYLKDQYGDNVEWWIDKKWLNREVKIIEDNIIEKIEDEGDIFKIDTEMPIQSVVAWQKANNMIFKNKINEIIDKIDEIESKVK